MAGLDKWGPAAWTYLATVCHAYPSNPTQYDSHLYKSFFTHYVPETLPCASCKKHYQDIIKSFPPRLTSRTTLTQWWTDIHNQVSRKNGKREYTYEEADRDLAKPPAANHQRTKNRTLQSVVVLIIVTALLVTSISLAMASN